MSNGQQELDIITNANGIGPSALENFKQEYESLAELGSDTPQEMSDKVSGVGYSTAVNVLKYLENEGLREESSRDEELERLVELLQDLFEFNKEDRDFGIYKLMNANRDKIDAYIKNDLVDEIENEVSNLHSRFSEKSKEEVREDVIDELGAKALDGDSLSQKALNMIDERTEGPDKQELENIRSEIYNYIYQFFSHYYESGDFINRRRRTHQSEPYSVPYDGSNTNFHWVTKNQYYSKTSEQFTRFTFKLNGYQYCFKTVSAELDGSGIGNSEYFVMCDRSEIEINEKYVVIPFYRRMIGDEDLERFDISPSTRNKQSSMNETFADEIDSLMNKKDIPASQKSIAEKIDEYTARNQNDFFIHKNIEEFLLNELEEYVKSEIVGFSPKSGIESMSDLDVEKGRIVTEIVTDIISFLSQLEEFKRKLFEKKKFVKNSEKLVQVKNVPDENYGKLLENDEQVSDWEESLDIDSSVLDSGSLETYPYSEMMVDTTYFEEDITTGEESQNKLIKGDNYQALSFLKEKYENSVNCIYIDPPYNTGNANFAYKDKYQRPTWLSMVYTRLKLSKELLSDRGVIFISIDENEIKNIRELCNNIFGEENQLTTFIWKKRGGGSQGGKVSTIHEYVLAYAKDIDTCGRLDKEKSEEQIESNYPFEDDKGRFRKRGLRKVGQADTREERPSMYYPIESPDGTDIYPEHSDGTDGRWRIGEETFEELKSIGNILFDERKGEWKVYKKERPFDSEGNMKREQYESILSDVPMTAQGGRDLESIIRNGTEIFDYPKPVKLIKHLIKSVSDVNSGLVLDFFAGSGTTAQAVQELNREQDQQVSYIMVEMLDRAFDITKERVKRTAYTKDWKDGKPQIDEEKKKNMTLTEVANDEEENMSFDAEYIELESYEEALDAIEFGDAQKTINRFNATTLNYLLEFGTNQDSVFLDSDQLPNPTEYKLNGSIESKEVDIMTTFNYLIGLQDYKVKNMTIDEVDYTIYDGHIENESTLVIWRHEEDQVSYEEEFEELEWDEYDKIYINGDSSIEKSKPIAPTFSRKMNSGSSSMLD